MILVFQVRLYCSLINLSTLLPYIFFHSNLKGEQKLSFTEYTAKPIQN